MLDVSPRSHRRLADQIPFSPLILAGTILGCAIPQGSLLPSGEIRRVEDPNEIQAERPIDDCDRKPFDAIDGYRVAQRQAKEWSTSSSLIRVHQKISLTWAREIVIDRPQEKTRTAQTPVVVWLFAFRGEAPRKWLGVTLDSCGVVDAAEVEASQEVRDWPAISRRWLVDLSDLREPKRGPWMSYELFALRDGHPIWMRNALAPTFGPRETFIDAISGEERRSARDSYVGRSEFLKGLKLGVALSDQETRRRDTVPIP